MAFCEQCGGKVSDNAKFCSTCGSKVNIPSLTQQDIILQEKNIISQPIAETNENFNSLTVKKSKKAKIILIVCGLVLLITTIVITAMHFISPTMKKIDNYQQIENAFCNLLNAKSFTVDGNITYQKYYGNYDGCDNDFSFQIIGKGNASDDVTFYSKIDDDEKAVLDGSIYSKSYNEYYDKYSYYEDYVSGDDNELLECFAMRNPSYIYNLLMQNLISDRDIYEQNIDYDNVINALCEMCHDLYSQNNELDFIKEENYGEYIYSFEIDLEKFLNYIDDTYDIDLELKNKSGTIYVSFGIKNEILNDLYVEVISEYSYYLIEMEFSDINDVKDEKNKSIKLKENVTQGIIRQRIEDNKNENDDYYQSEDYGQLYLDDYINDDNY